MTPILRPPSTPHSNRHAEPKEIVAYPDSGHEGGGTFQERTEQALAGEAPNAQVRDKQCDN
jgi:hypothetical protein